MMQKHHNGTALLGLPIVIFILLELPLSKPTFVEGKADIDAETVFLDQTACIITNPLSTHVEYGTIVESIHDRNTDTGADRQLARTVLAANLDIRSRLSCTQTITNARHEATSLRILTILEAGIYLMTVHEQAFL